MVSFYVQSVKVVRRTLAEVLESASDFIYYEEQLPRLMISKRIKPLHTTNKPL